jgi:opacity protein-like surface antigen
MKRLALAACLLAVPSAALADGDYRFELTPHVSYHFGGSFDAPAAAPFGTLDLDEGMAWGVIFDIPLSNNLQLELLYNRQETDLFANGGILGPDHKFSHDLEIVYAHLGLLAQFGRPAVTPYFVVSAGLTRFDSSFVGARSDTRFSASLGGGVKLFFTDHIGLRFEGRGFWTKVDSDSFACSDGECFDVEDHLSQGQATVGLILAW